MLLTQSRRKHWRLGLYSAALFSLLAVYMMPRTHRVVREDLTTALRVCGFNPPERSGRPNEAFAAAHPDDDALQVALALSRDPQIGETQDHAHVRNLVPLMDRYPRSAIVRTAVLRYAVLKKSIAAAFRKEFYRAASEGERLEPDNAFYPAMVWALDWEKPISPGATRALFSAASKTRWDEHVREEAEGRWRLVQGDDPVLSGEVRMLLGASIFYPHYAKIREAAKSGVKHAGALERHGHANEGIAVRHAVMRVGSLMRSQSTTMIGNLDGSGITWMAAKAPGGHPSPKGAFTPARRATALAAYVKYLVANGRPDEAEYARRQFKSCESMVAIGVPETSLTGLDGYLRVRMMAYLVLLAAAFTLLSARVAALLARVGCAGDGRPVRKWAAFLTVYVGGSLIIAIALRLSYSLDQTMQFVQSFGMDETRPGRWLTFPWSALVVLSGPIVLKVFFLVTALVKRRPIVATVVQGLRRFAAPLAAGMVIGYGIVLQDVAHRDRVIGDAVTEQIRHEGRYYAHLQGKQWPE